VRGTGAGSSVTWHIGPQWPARVGRIIKGMFVALALVLTLSREPDPLSTLLALAGAVLAFTLGEVYDAAIEEQIRNRRGLLAAEFRSIAVEQSFICVGALPSVLIYALAVGGLISTPLADNVTLWTGIVLLGSLGVLVGRLAEETLLRCARFGVETALVGVLIVILKVAVKKI
jgi:hypothetical protein